VEDGLVGHKVDVYLPEEGDGPFPVIIAIAGSAWFGNDTKGRAYQIGRPLLDEGFAIVAVNHRSSREAIFPAQINDIKAAVRFVRGNATTYRLDTRFVGITGDSSGGHLSALMGTTVGVRSRRVGDTELSIEGDLGTFTNESSAVDAIVDWYGPSAFQKMDACGSSFSHDAVESPESTLVGGPIQENDAMCALANPITYIDAQDPPFLILHGDADPLVPHCQSELLHEALVAAGVESRLIIVPGGGHGEGMWIPKYIDEMTAFFVAQKSATLQE
jgi:acetyl esterase/lipase